jgi:hypothetical protein
MVQIKNAVLQIGGVTQTVEVQAVAPLLNTANATVGTTITNSNVLEMPSMAGLIPTCWRWFPAA